MSSNLREIISEVGKIYTPAYPIELRGLFSGRDKQLQDVLSFTPQKGKQLVIYGDGGVGKTSFANIIKVIFEDDTAIVKWSCASDDTFQSLWHNILGQLSRETELAKQQIGFGQGILMLALFEIVYETSLFIRLLLYY